MCVCFYCWHVIHFWFRLLLFASATLPPAEEKNENGDDKTGNTDSTRQKEQVAVLRIRRVDDLWERGIKNKRINQLTIFHPYIISYKYKYFASICNVIFFIMSQIIRFHPYNLGRFHWELCLESSFLIHITNIFTCLTTFTKITLYSSFKIFL